MEDGDGGSGMGNQGDERLKGVHSMQAAEALALLTRVKPPC